MLIWIIFAKQHVILKVAPTLISAAQIQLLDITPEEAQKLITQQVNDFFIDLWKKEHKRSIINSIELGLEICNEA